MADSVPSFSLLEGIKTWKCHSSAYFPTYIKYILFEIPLTLTVQGYRSDLISDLSLYIYKLETKIGHSTSFQTRMLTVLYSGAGLNLIRAAILPSEVLNSIDTREVVNLASASNHRLDVFGIVNRSLTF